MRKIVHISDLHFGKIEETAVPILLSAINGIEPDLIVISGDFTQRAKRWQYEKASEFLKRLPAQYLAVPGNHDIPLYRVWERFTFPYAKYKKYISKDLEPKYFDKEIAVIGINSTHVLNTKNGTVRKKQVKDAKSEFLKLPKHIISILVTHHPFNTPVDHPDKPLHGSEKALKILEDSSADLLLSGHLHTNMRRLKNSVYRIAHKGPLIIHAGTAISSRLRGEPNSFNLIIADYPRVEVQTFEMQDSKFVLAEKENFTHDGNDWKSASTN